MPTEQEIQFVRNVRANNPACIELWLGIDLCYWESGEADLVLPITPEKYPASNGELDEYVDYILNNQPFFDFEGIEQENPLYIILKEPEFNFSAEDVVDDEEKTWWWILNEHQFIFRAKCTGEQKWKDLNVLNVGSKEKTVRLFLDIIIVQSAISVLMIMEK